MRSHHTFAVIKITILYYLVMGIREGGYHEGQFRHCSLSPRNRFCAFRRRVHAIALINEDLLGNN